MKLGMLLSLTKKHIIPKFHKNPMKITEVTRTFWSKTARCQHQTLKISVAHTVHPNFVKIGIYTNLHVLYALKH